MPDLSSVGAEQQHRMQSKHLLDTGYTLQQYLPTLYPDSSPTLNQCSASFISHPPAHTDQVTEDESTPAVERAKALRPKLRPLAHAPWKQGRRSNCCPMKATPSSDLRVAPTGLHTPFQSSWAIAAHRSPPRPRPRGVRRPPSLGRGERNPTPWLLRKQISDMDKKWYLTLWLDVPQFDVLLWLHPLRWELVLGLERLDLRGESLLLRLLGSRGRNVKMTKASARRPDSTPSKRPKVIFARHFASTLFSVVGCALMSSTDSRVFDTTGFSP